MPHALHEKLKKQYGEKSKIPYKILASLDKKHGNGVAGMMRRKK